MYISGDNDMIEREGEGGRGEIERKVLYEDGNDRDYHDPINNRLYRLYWYPYIRHITIQIE